MTTCGSFSDPTWLPDTFPVVVASFPRSGTHLFIDILRNNFRELNSHKAFGSPLDELYVPLDIVIGSQVTDIDRARAFRCARRHTYPILKTHHLYPALDNLDFGAPEFKKWLNDRAVFFHVVRHPVQVAESLYEFEQSFRPIHESDRAEWLKNLPTKWSTHTGQWLAFEKGHTIHFEEMRTQPAEILRIVSDILDFKPHNTDQAILPPRTGSKLWRVLLRLSRSSRTTEIKPKGGTHRINFSDFPKKGKLVFYDILAPLMEDLGYDFLDPLEILT